MGLILFSFFGTLGLTYINYKYYKEYYIMELKLSKITVLDIFILLWSILPFIYVFLFWLPNITSELDMALMIYQSVFLMMFGIFTVLIPQLNTRISRVMINWMFVLQLYSGLSLQFGFRPKFLGSELGVYEWTIILSIYIISFIVGILLEPLTRNFLTRFKQTNTYE